MELTTIACASSNLHLENDYMFYRYFKIAFKAYCLQNKAFIMLRETVRPGRVKPGQSIQLSPPLKDDYTHQIILQQNYKGKEEITLARFLKPLRDSEDNSKSEVVWEQAALPRHGSQLQEVQ